MIACFALLISLPQDAEGKVTAKNWKQHPAIEDVRAVYQGVTAARAARALEERVRRAPDECWDWYLLRLATDTSSTARYFFRAGGGQDSTHRHAFFYDTKGTVRFALLRGAATNGSSIETRIWFDGEGKELYRTNQRRGPGWTWISGDPAMIIRDPKALFREGRSECVLEPPVRPNARDEG
ncbi:MAG: hypothetical protein IT384_16045 [Deltaproteobacteria bacterium]|nr:hypothetical protein [Deltaproteobacteria bacterium]